jgi:putative transposase
MSGQTVACRGNRGDNVTRWFWEVCFRAQLLRAETAITACMAYVDLNQIRTGIAASLETSDFTRVKERIEYLKATKD